MLFRWIRHHTKGMQTGRQIFRQIGRHLGRQIGRQIGDRRDLHCRTPISLKPLLL